MNTIDTAASKPAATQSVKETLLANMRQSGMFIALIAIIALFTVLTGGDLLTNQNITNLLVQNSYILILAVGMVIVIIGGHIDLSIGSVLALTGAIAGAVTVRMDMPWWAGVLAALLVGLIIGAWQGFWVAYVGIPAFVVTLAGMMLFRGLTMIVLGNAQISPFPDSYRAISSGYLNGLLGGYGFDTFTLLVFALGLAIFVLFEVRGRRAQITHGEEVSPAGMFFAKLAAVVIAGMALAWMIATYRGLPIVLIIMAVIFISYGLIMRGTPFGRHVYAIGGNRQAAALSGINTKMTDFWIFVHMGLLSAIAGVIFSARLNLAGPQAGTGLELDAIAAAYIGGAAVSGGIGRVVGALIGGLIMGVLNNGMSLMGIGSDYQQAIKGLVLLIAVAFDVWNKRRTGGTK